MIRCAIEAGRLEQRHLNLKGNAALDYVLQAQKRRLETSYNIATLKTRQKIGGIVA